VRKYILKRLGLMVLTLFMVLLLTFIIMHAVPGGPYTSQKKLPEAIEAALNEKYKLNDPLYKQFFDYLMGVLRFDLGPSFKYEALSVNDLIMQGFPTSATLGLLSMCFILLVSIPLGVFAALKNNKWQDTLLMFFSTLGVTVPSFVVSSLLLYFFALKLGWFPVFGVDSWKGYVLPAIALSGFTLAFITRLMRSSLLEVMGQDFIRTARSKGLSEPRIVIKHGMRNAMIPVITILGPMFASLLMGSFVVEKIFALPGMGRHFVQSITNRDYTAIMGFTLFYATILVGIIFIVDILYCLIDPRIKLDD